MFENFKKILKRTQKTCPRCEKETLSSWIIITPDGESLNIGRECKNLLCGYNNLCDIDIIFDAFDKAKDKNIAWWFGYLYNSIERCILLKQTNKITNSAWSSVSIILKCDLMRQYEEEKYGKSSPQKVDGEWLEPDVLLDAIPSDGGHCSWRLIKKEEQNFVIDKLLEYCFRG